MPIDLEQLDRPSTRGGDESTLDRIRARFRQAKQGQHLDMPFPGNPDLAVRYVAPPDEEMDRLSDSHQTLGIDYLVSACECILVREAGGYEPLMAGDEPVRFDETLSEILDLGVPPAAEGGTARDVVMAVFATAPSSKLAAGRHVTRLTAWLSGASLNEEEMLGES